METIDINEALPQITKLLEIASTGAEIIITKNNRPMVKLVSVSQSENTKLLSNGNWGESLQNLIQQTAEADEKLTSEKPDINLTPEQKSANWLKWVNSHSSDNPPLPDEALHRDTMYE